MSPKVCIGLWKAIGPCCLFRGYTLRRRWSDKCKTNVNTISAVAVNVDKYNVRQGTRFFIWLDEFKRKYRSMHLVSSRRQNLRLQNTVCVLVWRVLLDFVRCLLSPFVAYGREHVEYSACPTIFDLHQDSGIQMCHDRKTRRQCLQEALRLEAFFEIHEYRNYQKTIGFLASLFILSKFWILDKPWYIKVAEGSGYKQMLTKFPACSLLFHIFSNNGFASSML